MNTKRIFRSTAAMIFAVGMLSAKADPIVIDVYDSSSGATPASIGGFDLTMFDPVQVPTNGCGAGGTGTYSVDSPISGQVSFEAQGGGTPLCMDVQDPDWWQWDHGNVFTTGVPWVELVMPTGTRAFSAFVGANSWGRGWIEGIGADGSTTRTYFGGWTGIGFGPGATPGFGVYASGACSTITRVIIEPFQWGTGNFAINQDPCGSTTQVPEPGTLALFGLGLIGLALARRRTVL